MGMTMTQKILAAHAGLEHVEAGQLIETELDLVLGCSRRIGYCGSRAADRSETRYRDGE